MKKLVASVMALTLGASAAMAGGPVEVMEEGQPEVVEEKAASSGWLPLLLIPIVLCVVLCGSDDDTES